MIFIAWEYRQGDTAMFPLPLLRQRVVWSSCVTNFFLSGNLMSTGYYIPIYFQAIRGVTPTLSGVYLLPAILSQICAAVCSGVMG
jgi:hypothetical protein